MGALFLPGTIAENLQRLPLPDVRPACLGQPFAQSVDGGTFRYKGKGGSVRCANRIRSQFPRDWIYDFRRLEKRQRGLHQKVAFGIAEERWEDDHFRRVRYSFRSKIPERFSAFGQIHRFNEPELTFSGWIAR